MLKQKFLIQFGSTISLRFLGMISGLFVARIAGPEVLGTIVYAVAYVSIFGFITGLFGTGHIKLISEGRDLGDNIATYTRLQASAIAVFFIVVLSWFLFQKYFLDYSFENDIQEQVILITLVAVVLTKLTQFNNSSFTGQLKQAKANLPAIIRGILYQIGKIVIVLLGFKALGIASWNLLTAVMVTPVAFRLFRSLPYGKYNNKLAKEHFKIAVPIFLIVVLNALIGNFDKLILHHYTSSTELGYFAAAFSLGGMVLILGNTMGTIFFPLFSKLIKKDNWKTVNAQIHKFESFIAIFIFPFICLLAIVAEPILLLVLGEKYQASILPFQILIFASYFSVVGIPFGNILSGMGKFYLNFWLKLVKFLIYIIAVIYFTSPDFLGLGAKGLALNLLLVNLIHNLIVFISVKKLGKIIIKYKILLIYTIIISFSVITYFTSTYFSFFDNFGWLILIPIFIIIQFTLLYITGLMKKVQIIELADLLNPKKTFRYAKNEINETENK